MGQYITNGNIEVRNKDGGFGECHSVDTFSGGARNMDSFLDDEDSRTKTTGGAMPPRVAMGSQRFGMIRPMEGGMSGRDIFTGIMNFGNNRFAEQDAIAQRKRDWEASDGYKEHLVRLAKRREEEASGTTPRFPLPLLTQQ